jgi:hypothetical protein
MIVELYFGDPLEAISFPYSSATSLFDVPDS